MDEKHWDPIDCTFLLTPGTERKTTSSKWRDGPRVNEFFVAAISSGSYNIISFKSHRTSLLYAKCCFVVYIYIQHRMSERYAMLYFPFCNVTLRILRCFAFAMIRMAICSEVAVVALLAGCWFTVSHRPRTVPSTNCRPPVQFSHRHQSLVFNRRESSESGRQLEHKHYH